MATLEQGNRQFEYPSLTTLEYELFSALLHRTSGVELALIVGVSSGPSLNDNPSPTARTCRARTHNPIRHSTIIGRPKAGWRPRRQLLLTLQESNQGRDPLSSLPGGSTPQLLLRRAGFLILNLQIIHDLRHVGHSSCHLFGACALVF